jgi:hypothetical protein
VREVHRHALDAEPAQAALELPPHALRREAVILPSSIGLNVFVEMTISSRTSCPFVRSHSPMVVSLRPPPYASAVSKVVIPASHAASISANACSRVSPLPKKAGDEPMPPKLPQPRITRETRIPVVPR